jgi:hypothetical protein
MTSAAVGGAAGAVGGSDGSEGGAGAGSTGAGAGATEGRRRQGEIGAFSFGPRGLESICGNDQWDAQTTAHLPAAGIVIRLLRVPHRSAYHTTCIWLVL